MDKLDGMSMNIEQTEKEKLKAVFPQCFAEGKLDIDKLLSLCGEYIDNDFEKYKFEWHGKAESLRLAQKRSTGTLRPCPEESVHFDDTQKLYIEGANLEVLNLLKTSYSRMEKMIYIDPPYNTGNDFVYADDFADPMARYKEVTQQTTKSNPETMGRYHTNWLNMMYPRLRLAANLLRDDGVIFISIDDNEQANLKKMCDEIFGEENFVTQMIWQSTAGSNTGTDIVTVTESIYVYTKSRNAFTFDGMLASDASYTLTDEYEKIRGKHALDKLDRRRVAGHYSAALDFPIEMPDGTLRFPGGGSSKSSEGWNYLWSAAKVKWGIENGFIVFKQSNDQWNVYNKRYALVDNDGNPVERTIPFRNLITSEQCNTAQGTAEMRSLFPFRVFDFPKPTTLLKQLLLSVVRTDKEAIILDFFSGSATTAHAVMQLNAEDGGNRKFICVQLPEVCDEKSEAYKAGYKTICEIGKERIRRAGAKILAEIEEQNKQIKIGEDEKSLPDVGFKVFKLDTSNIKLWDGTPVDEEDYQIILDRMNDMIDSIKDDRTDMDVVYEIMLKMGVPLTYPVLPLEIDGVKAYSVGEDSLLMICLDAGITTETIEQLADYAPAKIVIAESCFADVSAMRNAHYVLRDRKIELKLI